MTPKTSKKAARVAALERKVLELEAQLVHVYHFARIGIAKAGRDRTRGSAVVVRLTYLGGAEVCPPFALKDGLSPATIEALTEDVRYSYERTTELRP